MAQIPSGDDAGYYISGRGLFLFAGVRPLPKDPPLATPAWWANEGLKDAAAGVPSRIGSEASATDPAVTRARPARQPEQVPVRLTDDAVVVNLKARLRAALLKQIPAFMMALVSDAQPSPEELKRFNDYKASADYLKAAETIEGAVTAVVTAINPLAGAIVGVGVAGVAATQEVFRQDIERYVAPWAQKNAGITSDIAMKTLQTRAYNYRGFSSVAYGDVPNNIYGIWTNQPDALARQGQFEDYVDSLLVAAGNALAIQFLHRYFPINLVTEKFAMEDRDMEQIKRDSQGFPIMTGRIASQYLPAELEKATAEVILAKAKKKG